MALCATLSLLALTSASASALTTHPFLKAFGPTAEPESAFSNIQSLAIDQASGDVYVLDTAAAEGTGAILKFDAEGNPADFSSTSSNEIAGVGGTGAGEAQLAVDNSSGPAKGDIYLARGEGSSTIAVYSAAGALLGELAKGGRPWGKPCGVAVDPAGNLYVGLFPEHVNKYTPTTNLVTPADYVSSLWGLSNVCQLAADSALNIFGDTLPEGPLTRFEPSQLNGPEEETPASGATVDARGSTVAVDPETDDLYVDEQSQVSQFGPHGEPFEAPTSAFGSFGPGLITGSFGIAVSKPSGDVYVSDGQGHVKVFGAAVNVEAPVLTISAPTGVTTSQATLHGTVNPEGTEAASDTHWHFEYSSNEGASWESTPVQDAGAGTAPVDVEATITGLIPNEALQVRLTGENEAAQVTSSVESFTTPALAPTVTTSPAQDVASDHASLQGRLDPNNAATTYFFEYGTSTAYGSSVPTTQDASAGPANEEQLVIENVQGLQPATTYHFRLVAHNLAGTEHGADQSFTTSPAAAPNQSGCANEGRREEQHATYLPECRAYEVVSPQDKNGGDVMANASRTRASVTGEAVDFASLTPFADAEGSGIAGEYISERNAQVGTSGWATHSIIPQVGPLGLLGVTGSQETYYPLFSEDLSTGVLQSHPPLASEPNVAAITNLYQRNDALDSGPGTYQLLSGCPGCTTPVPGSLHLPPPRVADATPDLQHLIFESSSQLTSDAPAEPEGCRNLGGGCKVSLYESEGGSLRFVGLIPPSGQTVCGNSGPTCEAAPVSIAGPGAIATRYTLNTISDDGSKIFFTVPPSSTASAGDLYMRLNHTTTVQLNASERTDCADHDPCTGKAEPDPNGPQPATFALASPDGSKVFFTSEEQLTNTVGGDLYVYDTDLPPSDPNHLQHVFTDEQPADGNAPSNGVLGTSSDGSYLYFLATGAILPGQPHLPGAAENGLYAWHDGSISLVGSVDDHTTGASTLPNSWHTGSLGARVTPDGNTLLFTAFSGVGLTGYGEGNTCNTVSASGTGPCPNLFLYKTGTGTLRCVSCNSSVSAAKTAASVTVRASTGATLGTPYLNRALSDDGEHVFFETGEALVPQDKNGNKSDVYEYDVADASLHLISSGASPDDSHFLDASPDGHDVFFTTNQRLVGWDQDDSYDLYDARVGGGVPEPPLTPSVCSGEGCHGALAATPSGSAPLSTVNGANGNLSPPAATPPVKKPPAKLLTRAQKLKRALQACHKKKPRRSRRRCEAQARKRFHVRPAKKAAKARRGK